MCRIQAFIPMIPPQFVGKYHGTCHSSFMYFLQSRQEHKSFERRMEHITEGMSKLRVQQLFYKIFFQ
jgi:hypothetical protein